MPRAALRQPPRDVVARRSIGVRADHHHAPAALVDDQVGELGEALRQPLLGAAVGRARRKHDERLIEIEADVAQQLPRLRARSGRTRAYGGPAGDPERRRQRLVVRALMQLAVAASAIARVSSRAAPVASHIPIARRMPAFAAISAAANEFGNRIAVSNDPAASAAHVVVTSRSTRANPPPPGKRDRPRSTPSTIVNIGATDGRAATARCADGK